MSRRGQKRELPCSTSPNDKYKIKRSDGLRLTSAQLIELWAHDNECGRKYMAGCPLRTCSSLVAANAPSDEIGLTVSAFRILMERVESMWRKAASLFEVFKDKAEDDSEHDESMKKGYRLRVKEDAPLKLSIKQMEAVEVGWMAKIPQHLSGVHVFKRSPMDDLEKGMDPGCYLGGPASFMNYSSKLKEKVKLVTISNHSYVKMHLKGSLPPGTELMWDYGMEGPPIFGRWFLPECCQQTTVDAVVLKRYEHNMQYRDHWFRECCVLCGHTYPMGNKDNRVQRKQHLVGSHAAFLASAWDGRGAYERQEVDSGMVLLMADKLNTFLQSLRSMNWNVVPACQVLSQEELNCFDIDEFHKKIEMLKKFGSIVLRGFDVPHKLHHFQPIETHQWKTLLWKDNAKPLFARYAVPPHVKKQNEEQVPSLISSFFENYMQDVEVDD